MKFSSVLLFASAVVSVLAAPAAFNPAFKLKVTRKTEPRDLFFWQMDYLQNFGNYASFGTRGGKVVVAHFADDASRGRLIVNGTNGAEDNAFLLPSGSTLGIFNFTFGGPAVAGSRSTDWSIADDKLLYGSEDRFYAFPTTNEDGWQVRWIEKGAVITANGFPVHLAVEYLT